MCEAVKLLLRCISRCDSFSRCCFCHLLESETSCPAVTSVDDIPVLLISVSYPRRISVQTYLLVDSMLKCAVKVFLIPDVVRVLMLLKFELL